jgi:hypothetical protein
MRGVVSRWRKARRKQEVRNNEKQNSGEQAASIKQSKSKK